VAIVGLAVENETANEDAEGVEGEK